VRRAVSVLHRSSEVRGVEEARRNAVREIAVATAIHTDVDDERGCVTELLEQAIDAGEGESSRRPRPKVDVWDGPHPRIAPVGRQFHDSRTLHVRVPHWSLPVDE